MPMFQQPVLPEIPAGLPSALLAQRPDLLDAEQQVVQANALVGVAKANFSPQLTLTGFGGGAGPELSAFTTVWSLEAGLSGPIFEGGRFSRPTAPTSPPGSRRSFSTSRR
jgi:outer membrane protein TolC